MFYTVFFLSIEKLVRDFGDGGESNASLSNVLLAGMQERAYHVITHVLI